MIHPEPHPLAGQKVMLVEPCLSGHIYQWCLVVDWYSRIVNCANWLDEGHGMDNRVKQLKMNEKAWHKLYPDDHDFILGEIGHNHMPFIVHNIAIGPLAPTWKELNDEPEEKNALSNIWRREDSYTLRLFRGSDDLNHDHFWSEFWHLRDPNGLTVSKFREWNTLKSSAPLEPADSKLLQHKIKYGEFPVGKVQTHSVNAKPQPIARKAPAAPSAPPRREKTATALKPLQQELF